jgi:hypothetical protein
LAVVLASWPPHVPQHSSVFCTAGPAVAVQSPQDWAKVGETIRNRARENSPAIAITRFIPFMEVLLNSFICLILWREKTSQVPGISSMDSTGSRPSQEKFMVLEGA